MAVIQKIRDKYAKVAGALIVLALVGFILTDLGRSGRMQSTTIGKINGEKVDYKEYEDAITLREQEALRQNPNGTIDDNTRAQLRDQVWNQLVSDKLMADINEKLGITVSKEELKDLETGNNPDPSIRQAFTNPQTGLFNPQEVAVQIQQIKKDPEGRKQWEAFENDLIRRRYTSKFNSLISGAVYVPKFVLDDQYTGRNSIAKVNYVKLPYTLINDNEVKVTDDEIKKYMEERKAMFQVKEPSRSIQYVAFDIVPSAEDSARILGELDQLKTEFATTTDNESFVNRNSQLQVPVSYYTRQQLQGMGMVNAEELMNAPVNTVIGPFSSGPNILLAKIEDKKTLPDSVNCRHILVKVQSEGDPSGLSDTAAKLRIDSVVAMVKGGVPFDSLVARYSDDPGSKSTGGAYDFPLAQRAGLAKEFGDFIFEGHTGENKIVKTQFGYHYIEILKQGKPEASNKIAFIAKDLNTSENTNSNLYNLATQFAAKVSAKGADFEKIARASGYNPMPADGLNANSYLVNGLGSKKELVRWAYDDKTKLGDVSPEVFNIGDKFVVAKLTGVMEPGLAPINSQTRPVLEGYVRKMKKAKLLMEQTKGKGSLDAIAQAKGQQVGTADSLNFLNGFIPGVGGEPKVVGYAYHKGFKENTVSPAIEGQEGVFYLSLLSRTPAATNGERNLPVERQMAEYMIKNNAANMVLNGLRESMEVEDARGKFYK